MDMAMVVFIGVGTATILVLQALEIVVYESWFQGIGRGCDRRLLKRHLLCTHCIGCPVQWSESNITNWPPCMSQTRERYFMKPLHISYNDLYDAHLGKGLSNWFSYPLSKDSTGSGAPSPPSDLYENEKFPWWKTKCEQYFQRWKVRVKCMFPKNETGKKLLGSEGSTL